MPPLPLALIEIRALTHATENPEKVYAALKRIAPPEVLEEALVEEQKLEGHYGNPITLLRTRIKRMAHLRGIVELLLSTLPPQDLTRLREGLEEAVDEEGTLYLRLDKEAAYLGELRLGGEETLRLQIKTTLPKRQREEILKLWRQTLS